MIIIIIYAKYNLIKILGITENKTQVLQRITKGDDLDSACDPYFYKTASHKYEQLCKLWSKSKNNGQNGRTERCKM